MSTRRRLGRLAAYPLIRILDGRFADVVRRVTNVREVAEAEGASTRFVVTNEVTRNVDLLVGEYAVANVESLNHVGSELRRFDDAVAALGERFDAQVEAAAAAEAQRRVQDLVDTVALDALQDSAASIINFADGHEGFAAQAGLWFNPPVYLRHHRGGVDVALISERLVEVPFAYAALGRLEPGARVLDFGAAESLVALSAAALGYQVTAIDLRQYPFTHPNLITVASPIERWSPPRERFDAVLCVSTVEHVGLEWYGRSAASDDRGDLAALRMIREMLTEDGLLVLTVPYGTASVDALQRTYDAAGLDELLEGWTVVERRIVAETAPRTWEPVEDSDAHAVALITARPA